jgi:hypothetical protein
MPDRWRKDQPVRLTPHQRAMKTASTTVTCIRLSMETHSSMPWMLEPVGPKQTAGVCLMALSRIVPGGCVPV